MEIHQSLRNADMLYETFLRQVGFLSSSLLRLQKKQMLVPTNDVEILIDTLLSMPPITSPFFFLSTQATS